MKFLPLVLSVVVPLISLAGYSDPARFEKDIAAFEAGPPAPEGAVVCVGSSSMRMWKDNLAADLAPLTVIPRGFGGSTMHDVVHFSDRLITALKPRAILLYEGDNDVAQGVSAEGIRDEFLTLVETVRAAQPGLRIYVMSIKPSGSRWRLWPEMSRANTLLAEVCAQDENLTFIDVATCLLQENGQPDETVFREDRLHLNRNGYERWRDVVRPVLLEHEGSFEP